VVLVILLAGLATVAVWRMQEHRQQLKELEQTSLIATALESARAQFNRQEAILAALVFADDPALLDQYHKSEAKLEHYLREARAWALAKGDADEILAVDDLTERIGQFNETLSLGVPFLLEADPETRVQIATSYMAETVPEADAMLADLEELVDEEQQELAARRAAADRAADTTLWLLIGLSVTAFVVAVGVIAMLIVSVIRPLAVLRASARAITAGDPEARAKMSGPEEVASLARDFNEMTDALAAKTKEHIDTANLTGVMLLKLDKDGRCVSLNDATSEFLGKPEEEILGAEIARYLHPDDVEPTNQALREMIRSKEPMLGVVSRYVTPLGTRVAEWNAHPLFDEEGRYAGFQGTGRDITERKRAEEELRESESKHRTLLENLPQKNIL